MAIAAGRLALDLSALPWHAERFGVGFYLGHGVSGSRLPHAPSLAHGSSTLASHINN
jgi:hypothetical protein